MEDRLLTPRCLSIFYPRFSILSRRWLQIHDLTMREAKSRFAGRPPGNLIRPLQATQQGENWTGLKMASGSV